MVRDLFRHLPTTNKSSFRSFVQLLKDSLYFQTEAGLKLPPHTLP